MLSLSVLISNLLFWCNIWFTSAEDTKVPVVADHNNQIRVQLGGRLRLECPVYSTSTGTVGSPMGPNLAGSVLNDESSTVMYHWRVRNILDYMLDSDSRYRFSQDRRVLEVTVPVELSDSGTYICTGVTGFGKREATFEVQVRDPDADLLCATQLREPANIKAPCFLDPVLKQNPVITIEKPVGSSIKFNCEADGTEPIRYRWLMGHTVADWITTSQGTRGPVLTIDQVGREHTGHYTCQVSNLGGTLNYTYRLVVTELPSATPTIITSLVNKTFTSDASASIAAQIQCACDEPVVQWLKRVEPGDDWMYQHSNVAKIALPNARASEQNEMFRVLGSWVGSPAVLDPIVVMKNFDEIGSNQPVDLTRGKESSQYQSTKVTSKVPENQIFLTRIHLQKPLEKERHSGKYVLMTMSLADVKSMEYVAIYVDIAQDPNFLKGRRILLYFLVPFSLLFVVVGMIAYIIVCRRRSSGDRSNSSIHDRCILRPKDPAHLAYQAMSNSRKSSSFKTSLSNGHINGKHGTTILGTQSPLLNTELWQNASTNLFDRYNCSNDQPHRLVYYPTRSCHALPTSCASTSPLSNTTTTYLSSSQSTQRTLPFPPSDAMQVYQNGAANYLNRDGSVNSGFEAAYTQTESNKITYLTTSQAPNPFLSINYAHTNGTEALFDQYSAVSRSPLSSGNMTNHYTLPFSEYTRNQWQNAPNSVQQQQTGYLPA